MNNMKVATLTSSLLARKGTAVPSAFAPTAMPAMPPMPPAPTPPPAAAARQSAAGAVARPKRNATGRPQLSLRTKPDLPLKLKLVAAFRRESAQRLLVAAIERYLDQVAPSAAREEYAWMAKLEDELPYWPGPAGRASYDMTG